MIRTIGRLFLPNIDPSIDGARVASGVPAHATFADDAKTIENFADDAKTIPNVSED